MKKILPLLCFIASGAIQAQDMSCIAMFAQITKNGETKTVKLPTNGIVKTFIINFNDRTGSYSLNGKRHTLKLEEMEKNAYKIITTNLSDGTTFVEGGMLHNPVKNRIKWIIGKNAIYSQCNNQD